MGTKKKLAPSQKELISAMLEPNFYPTRPAEVTHKETHISHLFFAGDRVYKIKKAVRFNFLDYSPLAKRSHFVNEELVLNRRLAPSVYLDVLPITRDASGWHFGGAEDPVEYALLMRRLPEKAHVAFPHPVGANHASCLELDTKAPVGQLKRISAEFVR
ncbi:MAG: hypothetical protein WD688_01755, partial [Candidatus Binatia bacterium]